MRRFLCTYVLALSVALGATSALAAITFTGSYSPTTAWATNTTGYIGYQNVGTMTVSPTSTQVSNTCYIGGQTASYPSASGTATVNGSGAAWTNNINFYVGNYAAGTLQISNGGSVTANNNSGNYYLGVGYHTGANGTINVLNGGSGGGTLISGAAFIGGYTGSSSYNGTGTVTVDGSGSTWNTGTKTNNHYIYVGYNNTGTLNITNGGSVSTTTGAVYVGNVGNGTLNMANGGILNTGSGALFVAAGAGTGQINFSGTASTVTTGSLIAGASQMTGTATVNAKGIVSDGYNFVFNSPASLIQTVPIADNGGGTVTVNIDLSTTPASNGPLGAGYLGSASLAITNGTTVQSAGGYFGYKAGSNGTATIDGTVAGVHSTWNIGNNSVTIGNLGTGSLSITNGAQVSNGGSPGSVSVGAGAGSVGTLTIDGNDGSGNASSWQWINTFTLGDSGTGTLNVTNGGYIHPVRFNAGYSGAAGTGNATIDGAGSHLYCNNYAFLGNNGSTTIKVTNGGLMDTASNGTYVDMAYNAGSNATIIVDGAGSVWNNNIANNNVSGAQNFIAIGMDGKATVKITNGGLFHNFGYACLGAPVTTAGTGSGTVLVDGTGSTWTNDTNIDVGSSFNGQVGNGTLHVRGGGAVTATAVSVNAPSLLSIDVGRGSSLNIGGGGGTLTNNGTVRVVCGPAPAASNTYTPISATWAGAGTVQAVGGTWSSGAFTASSVAPFSGAGGATASIDTSSQQRMLITDTANGQKLGASFLATSSPLTVGLTASTALPNASALATLAGHPVLDGWTFSAVSGYNDGTDPAYLSLAPGRYYPQVGVQYWGYNGTTWAALSASDFTFDGTYASFTTTALGGKAFAVTGVAVLAGDANLDRTIDVGDLGIVLNNYNRTSVQWADGDFNGDGTVDLSDLSTVLNNYNATAAAGGVHPVPEPSAIILLAVAAVGVLCRAWRRRV